MALPAVVAAQLAKRTVGAALLVHFDFTSNPMWVWQGFGKFRDGNGQIYQGMGQLGSVDGLERAIGGTAPTATFALSGVDQILIAEALNSAVEVKGRDVTVLAQFLDVDNDFALLDVPLALYAGTLDVMSIMLSGPDKASIQVTAETVFARRASPPWGSLSDADQKRLYPLDRGLEMIAQIPFKVATWPIIEVTSK